MAVLSGGPARRPHCCRGGESLNLSLIPQTSPLLGRSFAFFRPGGQGGAMGPIFLRGPVAERCAWREVGERGGEGGGRAEESCGELGGRRGAPRLVSPPPLRARPAE